MAKQTDKSDQNYRSLRNEFDNLQLEEKAVFLIESGLSMLIHSVESLTNFVRDEVNKMAEGDGEEGEEAKKETEAPEEPKKKTRSTASKKRTSRSTSTRRKTTPKNDTAPKAEDDDADPKT